MPSGATISPDDLEKIVKFAGEKDIILCNDAAYNEIVFDNNKPVSLMNVECAKDNCIELGPYPSPII